MLPQAIVMEVQRLLQEQQLSHRAIANKLGISRGTVGNIAHGRRGLNGRQPAQGTAIGLEPGAIPRRCRGCGGLVYEPCLLCRARAYRSRRADLRRLRGGGRPDRHPRRAA
ncbi:MAG: hypothetical protein IT424_02915 [Pirellulales bacterium]|nr:hypothetical protein [Pirellulales bacterium]